MTELPPTYRVQDGCHNCCHFRLEDSEEMSCLLDGTDYPPYPERRLSHEQFEAWSEAVLTWIDAHAVHPAGICDQHERRTDG